MNVQRRIVIAGTSSGAGKTTITIGLMAALKKKGFAIQGFKCGPDYIDPSYHTAVTGRNSRNLDSWMLNHEIVKDIYATASEGADLSIIEGVMGFYDGKSPLSNTGSTAEISQLLDAPVILVVNISSMARSAAAIVKGYQLLDPNVTIAGVILNQAGSEGHSKLCQAAIEQECGIPVIGYLLKGDGLSIPERHLGLIPAIERGELDGFFDDLGEVIAERVDLDKVMKIAEHAPTIKIENSLFSKSTSVEKKVRIAVAHDAAFNFYYQENFTLLEQAGAELVFFSPLNGESLPENIDGLYIGGGFPEEFADELASMTELKEQVKQAVTNGLPTFAECGGYMFLTDSLTTTNGKSYPMVGVIPGNVVMKDRLVALGYREVTAIHDSVILRESEVARGHEFHYSTFEEKEKVTKAYRVKALRKEGEEGYYGAPSLLAGYTHIHFASNVKIAERFVASCEQYRKGEK
ncbi:cobyrinate a,c-diamide synthase [Bacillus sp. FJAT-45350]|uniref:cobyrinate a,c-diamide synthase n=1 Tax=Bacillus sp. FJAT-45350 TaxID=2011014 RepID=UPI000BB91866|nr:cobyrinate a,c-diamide synthase [Bacillus sp. FJAT-45350]